MGATVSKSSLQNFGSIASAVIFFNLNTCQKVGNVVLFCKRVVLGVIC